jgi:hypothetical protein
MKERLGYRIGCIVLLALLPHPAGQLNAASIIRVPANQTTIQAAINAAVNGDVIQVAPGTYVENLNFLGKAIRVVSDQGPQVTIIDGNRAGTVVTFASGETSQSVLSGFTLRNGNATASPGGSGGGVYVENSSPTILGNIITNNWGGADGGGIASYLGSPIIQGNMITNNIQTPGYSGGAGGGGIGIVGGETTQILNNYISNNSWATGGGGISLFSAGTATVLNNVIANNRSNSQQSQGGGLYIVNYSDVMIAQNLIIGNSAATGGGVYWAVPIGTRGPFFINNTFYANDSPKGSGISALRPSAQVRVVNNIIVAKAGQTAVYCDGSSVDSSVPTFVTNDVVSTSGLTYGGFCPNQTGSTGNISADPLFVNAAGSDFHLQIGSPAIETGTNGGTPQSDFDGVPRPLDGDGDGISVIDMGAFEVSLDHTPPITVTTATPSSNAGWNNTNVTVTFNATDDVAGYGVANIRYSLAGAQQTSVVVIANPGSALITAEGITTVSYAAVDNGGNVESSKSLIVGIDRTGPVIVGLPTRCQLTPAKHQLVQVATVTANDSLSGVSSLTVTGTSNQPDSGTSAKDEPGDIVINGGTVFLRVERAPSGEDRIYTITATASDLAGNSTIATATCTVPH